MLAVAGTPDTVHLIGAVELAAMRPACGADQRRARHRRRRDRARRSAAQRRIAGAGLDVFVEEPLLADHPLWGLPNVLITPHIAVNVPSKLRHCVEHFAENLRRYCAGEDLADRL